MPTILKRHELEALLPAQTPEKITPAETWSLRNCWRKLKPAQVKPAHDKDPDVAKVRSLVERLKVRENSSGVMEGSIATEDGDTVGALFELHTLAYTISSEYPEVKALVRCVKHGDPQTLASVKETLAAVDKKIDARGAPWGPWWNRLRGKEEPLIVELRKLVKAEAEKRPRVKRGQILPAGSIGGYATVPNSNLEEAFNTQVANKVNAIQLPKTPWLVGLRTWFSNALSGNSSKTPGEHMAMSASTFRSAYDTTSILAVSQTSPSSTTHQPSVALAVESQTSQAPTRSSLSISATDLIAVSDADTVRRDEVRRNYGNVNFGAGVRLIDAFIEAENEIKMVNLEEIKKVNLEELKDIEQAKNEGGYTQEKLQKKLEKLEKRNAGRIKATGSAITLGLNWVAQRSDFASMDADAIKKAYYMYAASNNAMWTELDAQDCIMGVLPADFMGKNHTQNGVQALLKRDRFILLDATVKQHVITHMANLNDEGFNAAIFMLLNSYQLTLDNIATVQAPASSGATKYQAEAQKIVAPTRREQSARLVSLLNQVGVTVTDIPKIQAAAGSEECAAAIAADHFLADNYFLSGREITNTDIKNSLIKMVHNYPKLAQAITDFFEKLLPLYDKVIAPIPSNANEVALDRDKLDIRPSILEHLMRHTANIEYFNSALQTLRTHTDRIPGISNTIQPRLSRLLLAAMQHAPHSKSIVDAYFKLPVEKREEFLGFLDILRDLPPQVNKDFLKAENIGKWLPHIDRLRFALIRDYRFVKSGTIPQFNEIAIGYRESRSISHDKYGVSIHNSTGALSCQVVKINGASHDYLLAECMLDSHFQCNSGTTQAVFSAVQKANSSKSSLGDGVLSEILKLSTKETHLTAALKPQEIKSSRYLLSKLFELPQHAEVIVNIYRDLGQANFDAIATNLTSEHVESWHGNHQRVKAILRDISNCLDINSLSNAEEKEYFVTAAFSGPHDQHYISRLCTLHEQFEEVEYVGDRKAYLARVSECSDSRDLLRLSEGIRKNLAADQVELYSCSAKAKRASLSGSSSSSVPGKLVDHATGTVTPESSISGSSSSSQKRESPLHGKCSPPSHMASNSTGSGFK